MDISFLPSGAFLQAISFGCFLTQEGFLFVAFEHNRLCASFYSDLALSPIQVRREFEKELSAYMRPDTIFKDGLHRLDLSTDAPALLLCGTPFQQRVWEALLLHTQDKTVTYSQLAALIGAPRATRAVASAVARNRIARFVPCHRVLPLAGGVGQYRWGSHRKKQLLLREGLL